MQDDRAGRIRQGDRLVAGGRVRDGQERFDGIRSSSQPFADEALGGLKL